MKCISRVLSIVCVISLFFTGCGFQQTTLTKEYDAYSYHNSFTNQEEVNVNYFAEDVCVTNTINFGLEGTYARVAQGGGIFNVTKNEVLYSQNLFKKHHRNNQTLHFFIGFSFIYVINLKIHSCFILLQK